MRQKLALFGKIRQKLYPNLLAFIALQIELFSALYFMPSDTIKGRQSSNMGLVFRREYYEKLAK